ncbi:nucleotidyl transferase AbiEii/AbiGii toxin family protein [Pedobacter sp. Du54]|uniref:nucleotidyl transferase AbiEii/AbiGii toxin family protein n=1 Tax=Pedobacter anseongensis TaxID=3133439 RepID=UPI00309C497D
MQSPIFDQFRLVGGTSLSLQLGHRMSIDIDLFTDAPYRSIDFEKIEEFLKENFTYVDGSFGMLVANGRSYAVGKSNLDNVKLDINYTDPFIREPLFVDGVRLASVEEIMAMKMEIVQHEGRKKDFWDIHEVLDYCPVEKMIVLHQERYPYGHDKQLIRKNLTNFTKADREIDPECLRGKHWELIKLDMSELAI